MISIIADNEEIKVDWIEFSDGALTCKIDPMIKGAKDYISLSVCPSTPCKQVLEEISLVHESLRLMGGMYQISKRFLYLPYLPYARADRVFEEGNPSPLHNFLACLDLYYFDDIHVCDIHNKSAVGGGLCSNIREKSQLTCFKEALPDTTRCSRWSHVVSPDKGATQKAKSIADWLNIPVIQASKKRDIKTGRITETTLDIELPTGSKVIIVDDLGDYCGTHVALGGILREQGCIVDLYVTHLIAPKGLSKLRGIFDKVYAYQTVGGYINRTDIMDFNNGKMY